MTTTRKRKNDDFEYKMVLVTRRDLSLSAGKLAAQVAHAAVDCALLTKKRKPVWFTKWYHEGGKKVVVNVEVLDEFYLLREKAKSLGIMACIVVDAGHTEIPAGTETVLGVGPAPSHLVDQVTGDLPLL